MLHKQQQQPAAHWNDSAMYPWIALAICMKLTMTKRHSSFSLIKRCFTVVSCCSSPILNNMTWRLTSDVGRSSCHGVLVRLICLSFDSLHCLKREQNATHYERSFLNFTETSITLSGDCIQNLKVADLGHFVLGLCLQNTFVCYTSPSSSS